MLTDTQRRYRILRRINRIPKDKLEELDEYLSQLEQEIGKKNRTLSFAGSWQDIDDATLDDLTTSLINKRQKNRRRIDE